MLVNENIVFMHAEDAAALWQLRERAVYRTDLTHRERTRLDGRVDAHLDGLRVATHAGWSICRELLLRHRGPGEVFAAGVLAVLSDAAHRLPEVLEVAAEDDNLPGLVSALGWHHRDRIEPLVGPWLDSQDALLRALALGALAVHRRDPGHALARGLGEPDPRVARRALQAAAELGRPDVISQCLPLLDDPHTRSTAAIALARLGHATEPVRHALRQAADHDHFRREAVGELVELDPRLAATEIEVWIAAGHLDCALYAIEALGDPAWVPVVVEHMSCDHHARRAGEAFFSLTGADLTYHDLDREPPPLRPALNDDPEDDSVELERDHALPWPHPLAVARWWRDHTHSFEPGVRYLLGQPVGWSAGAPPQPAHQAGLLQLAATATPRHRLDAARMLSATDPTRSRLEPRAFARPGHPVPGAAAWPEAHHAVPTHVAKHHAG